MGVILVTNDDGVHAPGLAALARALVARGNEIVVCAPLDDRSGSGAGIGPWHVDGSVAFETFSLPGLDGVPAYGVDGPPALAVLTARLGGFGPVPQIVASGINPGCNTGRAVLFSGTVGAALTAASFGASAVAVSIDAGPDLHWETAAEVAADAVEWMHLAPERTVLNINVPNLPRNRVEGIEWASLAPFGTVRAALVEAGEGRLQMELRAHDEALDADTDTALVLAGRVAVSAITGIAVADTSAHPVDAVQHLRRRHPGAITGAGDAARGTMSVALGTTPSE